MDRIGISTHNLKEFICELTDMVGACHHVLTDVQGLSILVSFCGCKWTVALLSFARETKEAT